MPKKKQLQSKYSTKTLFGRISELTFVHQVHKFSDHTLARAMAWHENYTGKKCIENACRLRAYKGGMCVLHEVLSRRKIEERLEMVLDEQDFSETENEADDYE